MEFFHLELELSGYNRKSMSYSILLCAKHPLPSREANVVSTI